MKNEKAVIFDDDNPEWMDQDFARARPAPEVVGAELATLLVRRRGRPPLAPSARKQTVNIRLDREVVEFFRGEGVGWQTRLNEVLVTKLRETDQLAAGILKQSMETQRKLATSKVLES
jgi:uncharacterized protein (DUF4415 family)